MSPTVSLISASTYQSPALARSIEEVLAPLGGIEAFVKLGAKVLQSSPHAPRAMVFPQVKPDIIQDNSISLPKLGKIRFRKSRSIPDGLVPKQVRVIKKASGYYISVCCACDVSAPDVPAHGYPKCGTHHHRDENASANIRAEGIRMLTVSGTGTAAVGGDGSPKLGRKVKFGHSPMGEFSDSSERTEATLTASA